MLFLSTEKRWPDFLRSIPYLFLAIAINSIAIFGFSFVHGKEVYEAPNATYRDYNEPSRVTEALLAIVPIFMNIFFALIAIVLHSSNQASPSRFLVMSLVFLFSWVLQFVYWTSCDIGAEAAATTSLTRLRFCVSWRPLAEFGDMEGGVDMAKFILGALCMSWWGGAVIYSGAAMLCQRLRRDFERWRDEEEGSRKGVGEDEESDRSEFRGSGAVS